jgi:hypothetical protein
VIWFGVLLLAAFILRCWSALAYPTRAVVIQVYAAHAVPWRGVLAVHTWMVIKPTGAQQYTRYEVVGFGGANGAPAVRVDRMGPDNYWFGAWPKIVFDPARARSSTRFALRSAGWGSSADRSPSAVADRADQQRHSNIC